MGSYYIWDQGRVPKGRNQQRRGFSPPPFQGPCSYHGTFGRDVLAPQYPWQSNDMAMNMLPPNHSNDFLLEPPGHNKENEDDVEVMSTDSSSSSSDSD